MRQPLFAAIATLALACATTQSAETSTAPHGASAPTAPAASTTTSPGAGGTMASGGSIDGYAGARRAQAKLESRSGSSVTGTAEFVEKDNRVELTLRVTGATPGEHGAHLHMTGDCSAPDAKSAGDHWNPAQHPHGAPDADQRHAGDLGNLTVGEDGTGTLRITRDDWSIGESTGKHDVLGKAVIVHGAPDDLTSQPAGNAGPRAACGVVSKAP